MNIEIRDYPNYDKKGYDDCAPSVATYLKVYAPYVCPPHPQLIIPKDPNDKGVYCMYRGGWSKLSDSKEVTSEIIESVHAMIKSKPTPEQVTKQKAWAGVMNNLKQRLTEKRNHKLTTNS